jgi:ABC-type sugar transport system permease subunit
LRRTGITAPRLFAVIAAIFMVGAVAIATVMPAMLSFGQFVALADHSLLVGLQDFVRLHLSDWTWLHVVLPLLQRPAWLMPASLGIIAAGLALTLNSRHGAPHSRRKRS